MKKNLLTLVVAWLVSCAAFATGIDRQQAVQLARDFMAKNFSEKSAARRAAHKIPLDEVKTGQSLVYAFNVEGGGYVVVAGDDCAPAILGFSETSTIDPQDIPDGMKYLFAQYQEEMQFMIQNGMHRAGEIANLGEEIKPLIKAKWGQGPPYNYMCPRYRIDDYNSRQSSLVGCVAVAMAQIMYYHKYPAEIKDIPGKYVNGKMKKYVAKPTFSDMKLEWDKMLPTYGSRRDVGGTQEQQDAVAKLMRLVGQSITMEYSPRSSGAFDCSSFSSYVNFFNYDATTIKHIQRYDYSYEEWIKTIYQELKAGRPVHYAGRSSSVGHAFVVDGYSREDFFYINWGWYGNEDGEFRLQLCNASKKYEGGGTGSQGYAIDQQAIIGIKPPTSATEQYVDPVPEGFFKWINSESRERKSIDEDFDLTSSINQWFYNQVHVTKPFGHGVVLRNEAGETVKKLLPLNDQTKSFTLDPGRQKWFNSLPIKLGAGLGDGTYTMEFMYNIDGGEWHSYKPVTKVMFKIKGNTLTFDSCPDWLEASMIVDKVEGDALDSYIIQVNLKNKSSDKTFQRSLKLSLDNVARSVQNLGVAVLLQPGEEKTFSFLYRPNDYTPKTLYLVPTVDGSPLCKAKVEVPDPSGNYKLDGTFNLTNDLKQLTDKSYVLKTDDTYEVVYKYQNAGNGHFSGYLALVDSIRDIDDEEFEKNVIKGEMLRLQPGDKGELRLTISNDDEPNIVHKIDFITYDDLDRPNSLDETKEFTIRNVFDLSFDNFKVTPTEETDDDFADYKISGDKATVSGKISNPEDEDCSGLVMIKRYTMDFSEDAEQDKDGNYYIECDKIYLTEASIPAKGSVNYSQEFDMQGLVKNKDYSVLVEFEIAFIRDDTGETQYLYSSDPYLLNDGTPTGINVVKMNGQQADGIYDLQGRRISSNKGKGIYIINGKKVILK